MTRKLASSPQSQQAYALVEHLQIFFVKYLDALSLNFGQNKPFKPIEWFRDAGEHGGGVRFVAQDDVLFNRASVNVSQVQYETSTEKSLESASAISTIIHPNNPFAPSMHMHISWTALKNKQGYWRIMADLNPSIEDETATKVFTNMLKDISQTYFEEGSAQGDQYFYIPALKRHRGVSHFYLENFHSSNEEADIELAKNMGEAVIKCYSDIIEKAIIKHRDYDALALQKQLEYHTVYLLQVLTLDRGTTSGLLIHNENDVGILGSIPAYVSPRLLRSWIPNMPKPQDKLLEQIINVLPDEEPCLVDDETKQKLADVVREHYLNHKDALGLQARGNTIPDTVKNHK